jgi:restriction system protein
VTPLQGAADLQLEKKGVITLVSAKRWKAATMGVESLRELVAQRQALEAGNSVCISLGQVSDKARAYAAENRVTLISGVDLVVLTAGAVKNL